MRSFVAVLALVAAVSATPLRSRAPLSPDPAGVPHVGNGKGEQFITGQCLSNADCASACCATLGNIGICSGPGAAFQQGKTGCGFGGGGSPPAAAAPPPPPAAAASSSSSGLKPDPAGVPHIGNGKGEQFITGQCLSNADCASACCATLGSIGICSGPDASFQQGKTGCGFSSSAAPPAQGAANVAAPPPPPAAAASSGLKPDPAGVPHVGNGKGEQFITGQCLSNADCASACCATLGSIGICSGPDASFQQGKTGCGFSSSAAPPAQGAANVAAPPPPPAAAASSGLKPDPAGVPHVGNGKGEQFITGQCLSNADCASTCCATLGSIGICSGPDASFQQGKTGCGFGGSSPAPAAAAPPPPPAAAASTGSGLKPDPAGVPHVGNGKGEQFITGQCLSNADCASACCATLGSIGICSGPDASFQQGKTGCGFSSKRWLIKDVV